MSAPAKRTCSQCGDRVVVTPSSHLRAHTCPHGLPCVLSYADRKAGKKRTPCPACFKGRQLALPIDGASE